MFCGFSLKNDVYPRTGNIAGSLLVFLHSRRASSCLDQRRLIVTTFIEWYKQEGLFCHCFTWMNYSVVSYYGAFHSSRKASSSIRPENRQISWSYNLQTNRMATSVIAPPFLPRVTIFANNNRGIPLRFGNTVAITIGHKKGYVQLESNCQQPYRLEKKFVWAIKGFKFNSKTNWLKLAL